MRIASLLLLAATTASALAAAPAPDPRLSGGYTFNRDGWTYVHLEGTPTEIGYQHGSMMARQIEDNVHLFLVE